MGVPHVDVQKPIVFFTFALKPILSDSVNLIRGFQTKLANVIGLIETRVPVKRRMPLRE